MTIQELKKEITYWEGRITLYEDELQNINLSQKREKMLKEHIRQMKSHVKMLENQLK
jgi:phage-related minor tail protein